MDKLIDLARRIWEAAEKGTAAWRIGLTLFIASGSLWATGVIGIGGTHGFAWADEDTAYRTKMALEVENFKGAINDLSKQMKAEDLQRSEEAAARAQEAKDASIRALRRQIFETERDGCNAKTDELRSMLLSQAQSLRADFMKLTGMEYPPLASCAAYR